MGLNTNTRSAHWDYFVTFNSHFKLTNLDTHFSISCGFWVTSLTAVCTCCEATSSWKSSSTCRLLIAFLHSISLIKWPTWETALRPSGLRNESLPKGPSSSGQFAHASTCKVIPQLSVIEVPSRRRCTAVLFQTHRI